MKKLKNKHNNNINKAVSKKKLKKYKQWILMTIVRNLHCIILIAN